MLSLFTVRLTASLAATLPTAAGIQQDLHLVLAPFAFAPVARGALLMFTIFLDSVSRPDRICLFHRAAFSAPLGSWLIESLQPDVIIRWLYLHTH